MKPLGKNRASRKFPYITTATRGWLEAVRDGSQQQRDLLVAGRAKEITRLPSRKHIGSAALQLSSQPGASWRGSCVGGVEGVGVGLVVEEGACSGLQQQGTKLHVNSMTCGHGQDEGDQLEEVGFIIYCANIRLRVAECTSRGVLSFATPITSSFLFPPVLDGPGSQLWLKSPQTSSYSSLARVPRAIISAGRSDLAQQVAAASDVKQCRWCCRISGKVGERGGWRCEPGQEVIHDQ